MKHCYNLNNYKLPIFEYCEDKTITELSLFSSDEELLEDNSTIILIFFIVFYKLIVIGNC